jgi:hypothetical protein
MGKWRKRTDSGRNDPVWQAKQGKKKQQQEWLKNRQIWAEHHCDDAQVTVSGCADATVSGIICGNYKKSTQNHGKTAYKRDMQSNDLDVMLYFWDDREGDHLSGWWIGPCLGSDLVWAYNPSWSESPPEEGWRSIGSVMAQREADDLSRLSDAALADLLAAFSSRCVVLPSDSVLYGAREGTDESVKAWDVHDDAVGRRKQGVGGRGGAQGGGEAGGGC